MIEMVAARRAILILILGMLALPVVADVGPPAHLQISEREPGVFAVQWRVPTVLPPRAVPMPELPPGCEPAGEPGVASQPAAWLFTQTWRCDGPLTGQVVGLRFPFPDLALTTVARVDLLSGDRFARLLTPGEPPWRLPEGTVAPDLVEAARDAVVAGGSHAIRSVAHLAFVLAVVLLGATARPLWLLGIFTLGQIVGTVAVTLAGRAPGVAVAELTLGVAAALLAREALRPEAERSRLAALAGIAGLFHGLAVPALLAADLGEEVRGTVAQLLTILGMDAVHLIGAGLLLVVFARLAPEGSVSRSGFAYVAGTIGAALAVGLAFTASGPSAARAADTTSVGSPAAQVASASPPASQRVAPAVPDASIQSFLAIEPFEVRHEVMIRLVDMVPELGVDPETTLAVVAQPDVAQRLGTMVLERTSLTIDGGPVAPELRRVDFMTVDATGALPRVNPQPEPVVAAMVGVVVAYPTEGMPQRATLSWGSIFSVSPSIPATVIDPESVRPAMITSEMASVSWENELLNDPIPALTAVAVEPRALRIPLLSLPLFVLAAVVVTAGRRGRRHGVAIAAARVALALGFVVGPLLATSIAVPGSSGRVPSEAQARRMLAGLLPNVYRALEFRDEARIYDRLAVTVTGDTLTEVYLQQRRSLELEERGGAQARVEAVEVMEASEVEPRAEGFSVRGAWTVGGMVTHFGHRHFRQNRYDARIGIVAVDGTWKIRTIEVLEQERVK